MNKGMKNDFKDDKLRWDLLPLKEIEDIVKVYTEGAKKYSDNSWQLLDNGYDRYKAALFRHLVQPNYRIDLADRDDRSVDVVRTAQEALRRRTECWLKRG